MSSPRDLPLLTRKRLAVLDTLRFLSPFVLTVVIYDLQRLYLPWLRGAIHIENLYNLERLFFGIESAGRLVTPNEWLVHRIHPMMDLLTGITYLLFIPQFLGVALYFRYALPRLRPGPEASLARQEAHRMAWAFLLVNLMGYITYVILPAAPPWYVSEYGFAAPEAAIPPNPAGGARFDQIIGFPAFHRMYAQSANVFGAIPSLHAAYPVVAIYFAYRLRSLRAFCVSYAVLISFSAIYLNHHYVLDVILGWAYGGAAALLCGKRQTGGA